MSSPNGSPKYHSSLILPSVVVLGRSYQTNGSDYSCLQRAAVVEHCAVCNDSAIFEHNRTVGQQDRAVSDRAICKCGIWN